MPSFFGIDLAVLIQTIGYLGLFAIVFAESGLFFGFFLPGDSLLFTAGFLASQGFLHPGWLVLSLSIAAIIGDTVGYMFGFRVGVRLFAKEDSRFFKQKYLQRARDFYRDHGPKALVLARFVPIVRTFVPIVAGVAQMDYKTFWRYNAFGGISWVAIMTLSGYFLGRIIPDAGKYLEIIVLAIIIISVMPTVFEVFKSRRV